MRQRQAGEDSGAARRGQESTSRPNREATRANRANRANRGKKTAEPLTRARRRELIAFVRQHHPELERLLVNLEKNRPEKYRAAAQGLNQVYERIQSLDDPKRKQRAIETWQAKSQIDLLAARIAIKDDPRKRAELKNWIRKSNKSRIEQLEEDRKRATQRLARIDQQLERIRNEPESEIDRQLELALRKIRNTLGLGRKPKRNGTSGNGTSDRTVDD